MAISNAPSFKTSQTSLSGVDSEGTSSVTHCKAKMPVWGPAGVVDTDSTQFGIVRRRKPCARVRLTNADIYVSIRGRKPGAIYSGVCMQASQYLRRSDILRLAWVRTYLKLSRWRQDFERGQGSRAPYLHGRQWRLVIPCRLAWTCVDVKLSGSPHYLRQGVL